MVWTLSLDPAPILTSAVSDSSETAAIGASGCWDHGAQPAAKRLHVQSAGAPVCWGSLPVEA